MPDPYHDLLIFDWATALSNTVLASRLLQVPQSTISRRMRAFQADHRLTIRRNGGGLKVLSPMGYLEELRRLAQHFRLLQSNLRWAAHRIWAEGLQSEDDQIGHYLNLQSLPQEGPGALDIDATLWLEQRLLDAYLDAGLCHTPAQCSWQIGIQHGATSASSHKGPVQLGAFAGLHGLEEALSAQGWTGTMTRSPSTVSLPALTLIPRHDGQHPQGILPLDLHVQPRWIYAPSLQMSDPHSAGAIKQFEAHLAITLSCLNGGSREG
jgi:hypothetical protein